MSRALLRPTLVLPVVVAYAFLVLPTVVVVGASFNGGELTVFPPSDLSLRWYGQAIRDFGPSFTLSLFLGLLTAALTVPLGIPAAIALVRLRFPGRDLIQTILLAPLLVPSLLIGVALLGAFVVIGQQRSFISLLLAHVLLTLPYVVRTIIASTAGIDPAVEESAAVLGASPRETFRRVTLPLMSSGIFAGALFAFVVSFGEINASVFLAGPSTTTLPIQIFSYLQWNSSPVIAAISVLQIAVTLALTLLIEKTVGLGKALQFG